MRKRGPSGGGTLRKKSPQQGQWPSLGVRTVISARIHWPRASQSGLMHCTVKPGKYCIYSPSVAAKLKLIRLRPLGGGIEQTSELPLSAKSNCEKKPRVNFKKNFANKCDGRDCGASRLWCQEKRLQAIVVRLRSEKKTRIFEGGKEVRRFSLTIRNSSY